MNVGEVLGVVADLAEAGCSVGLLAVGVSMP